MFILSIILLGTCLTCQKLFWTLTANHSRVQISHANAIWPQVGRELQVLWAHYLQPTFQFSEPFGCCIFKALFTYCPCHLVRLHSFDPGSLLSVLPRDSQPHRAEKSDPSDLSWEPGAFVCLTPMACKQSSFCSVAVLEAGAWLCMAWAFLSQHMDYNILFVWSLMSWEKVLLQSVWKLAQIGSSCFFLDCRICLKLFTCLLMVIPAHPQAVSSPNIVLLDRKNPRSSSLFGTYLTIPAKSLLKCHGPVCHRRSRACWGCPSGHFSDFCVCTATQTRLKSGMFFKAFLPLPPQWLWGSSGRGDPCETPIDPQGGMCSQFQAASGSWVWGLFFCTQGALEMVFGNYFKRTAKVILFACLHN